MGFTKKHLLLLFCMTWGFVGISASSTTPFGDIIEALDLYLSNCTVPDLKFPCNPDAGSRHATCHVKDEYCYRYGDSNHQSLNDCRQCHVPCLGETTVERDICEEKCEFYQYSECKKSQEEYLRNLITNYQGTDESKEDEKKSVNGGLIVSVLLNVVLLLGYGLFGYYNWRLQKRNREFRMTPDELQIHVDDPHQSEPLIHHVDEPQLSEPHIHHADTPHQSEPLIHEPQLSEPSIDVPHSTTAHEEEPRAASTVRKPEDDRPREWSTTQTARPAYPSHHDTTQNIESEHYSSGSDTPLPIPAQDSGTASEPAINQPAVPPPQMSLGLAGPSSSVGVSPSPGATGTSDVGHDSAASDRQPLTGEAVEAQDPSGQEPELVTSHASTKSKR